MSKYYLSKIILLILDNLKFLIKLIFTKNFIDKILYFIHGGVGYYGNLKSDLESLEKISILRDYFIPPKKKQKIKRKKIKKIGFLVNFSSRSLFNLDHFKIIPNNFEVFIFEFNNSVNGYNQSLKLFKKFKNKKIKVNILKLHKSWCYDYSEQSKIAKIINSFSLDCLIFDTGVFHLHLLNKLTTPKIISYNKTSLIVPSSKIDIQSFCQPCFPYKVKKNKIYNFKNKNNLNTKVDDNFIIYQSRKIKFKMKKKRKYILWYGNFKKFYDPKFLNLIKKVLIKYPSLEFHAFGRNDNFKQNSKEYFKKNKILNIKFHEIFDWNVKNRYFENFLKVLKQTRIMLNSFRMSGARYAIESYQFEIPIINYNLDYKAWLKTPDNLYYNVPKILIDENTVNNENNYLKLIDKILNDKNFEKKLISLQKKKFNHLTSRNFFWKKIFELTK